MSEQTTIPAAPAPPMHGLRPVATVARLTGRALLLAGLGHVLRAVGEIRLWTAGEPASGPPDQGEGVHRPLTGLENAYHLVTSFVGVTMVICAVLFISWMWRVRDNSVALSRERPKYLGFWVYLGWVLPVANLWVPRGVIADAYRRSVPGRKLPAVVTAWWVLWLLGMLSGTGLIYRDSTDQLIERAYGDVWSLLLSEAAMVAAAVTGFLMVRAVTGAQLERIASLTEAGRAEGRPEAG
ncbi:DUF4328 domain-containing protein [Streptomyces sp. LaPpAH-108]|uniref:DUF4328 domain-containing protein n=1 Tax=Streptomyces sp. LaPpAH-108 TaxID=1155714 RepID=UPI001F3087CE|nr:DUF4328 domain-containing protein [Streptomyces sp. LaPpAH-108]